MIPQSVWVKYENWRGEERWRHLLPLTLFFGTAAPFHVFPQWLMDATDLEDENRPNKVFALSGILEWRSEPPEEAIKDGAGTESGQGDGGSTVGDSGSAG